MKTHTLKTALDEIERLRKALQIIHVWAMNPHVYLREELEDIGEHAKNTLEDK